MDNLDEMIVEMRQKQQSKNTSDEMHLSTELSGFKYVVILEDELEMIVPKDFTDMDVTIAKNKYPSEQRPQCIKTSPNTTVDFGISLVNIDISGLILEECAEDLKGVLKKTNPAMEFFDSGVEELDDFNLAWFDYKSFAVDGQMYNIMFVANHNKKMLHGMFNCIFSSRIEWQDTALKCIKSIRKTNDLQDN